MSPPAPAPVYKTRIAFLKAPQDSELRLTFQAYAKPGESPTNFERQQVEIQVEDIRSRETAFSLDTHGFAYVKDSTSSTLELLEKVRSDNLSVITEAYYPAVCELVKRVTGAEHAVVMWHFNRKNDPAAEITRQPAKGAHCDMTDKAGFAVANQLLDRPDAEQLLKGRIRCFSVWRPTVGPVEDTPIAVMDGRTIAPENLHTVHSLGHAFAMPDSYFEISSSPTQKWYYLGGQRTDEVLFIKQYDSEEGVCKRVAHSAFDHPLTPPDAAPRESIDVAVFAFGGH